MRIDGNGTLDIETMHSSPASGLSYRGDGQMASFQRVALFILFDSIEADLVRHIRNYSSESITLTEDEREKGVRRLSAKADGIYNLEDPFDLLYGLDLAEKFQVLMRCKAQMDPAAKSYFQSLTNQMMRSVSVRNDIMHGRPLTIDEQVFALALAQDLIKTPLMWPSLTQVYREYTQNPHKFMERSVEFLDEGSTGEILHNLPIPDYDDTGFLPRPELERDLKKKILGRHPVVTVLGEGGNGKTALALRVLYGLVVSNDHPFDAIIWVSAKTSQLELTGVREIQDVAISAIDLMESAAVLEPSGSDPVDRIHRFMSENKVLLVVDNYETVIGDEIARFAEDIPGESKLLFTSRKPVGSDLTVPVGEFSSQEAFAYAKRLMDAYAVTALREFEKDDLDHYLGLLSYKPLLIKWFVLGVQSGLQPDVIVAHRDTALRFCLDNVILTLGEEAQAVLIVLATLPARAAAGIVAHVARLTSYQVADGLAELSRVGLVDAVASPEGRQIFGIRSFARTYVHRLLPPKPEITEKILSSYRSLEAEFQAQRNRTVSSFFRISTIKVESRPQMLAAEKLRQALAYDRQCRYDLAETYLSEAKEMEPTYFEAFKIEALISIHQNDLARAITAYETAIQLAPSEPQLHFFLGGLLLRLNENDRAAEEFANAISLADPDSILFREAARNELYRSNYEEAQALLSRSFELGNEVESERVKLIDLQVQIHGRRLEYELRHDRLQLASQAAGDLAEYVSTISDSEIDSTMLNHILNYKAALLELADRSPSSCARRALAVIQAKDVGLPVVPEERIETHIGRMKRHGRRNTFAFLGSDTCPDTYVHVSDVSADVWLWMLDDGPVEFSRLPGERGKAVYVRQISGKLD